jgi:hypothetical protein
MKRATILILVVLGVLAILTVAGCGNVTLKGDSMTAAEVSTLDAYNASQRAGADPNIPHWTQVYLDENFKQWRCFVWSAKKDVTWGPKLPSESATGGPAPGTKAGG